MSAGGARPGLSACVIAMNEEDRLGGCLDSLAFCDEILVVDSHSTDGTRELAASRGARVIERDWPGFIGQREFAIRAAANDWVLCLDADERVSPELRAAIEDLRERGFPEHAGWRCPRLSNYFGTWMVHGTWYPNHQLRLFDRRRGHVGGKEPHDRVQLEGSIGMLRGDLHHYPYRNFREHLRTIDSYTTTMARGMFDRGRKATVVDLVVRPAARFFRFYFVKRGFLLGWKGLMLAYLVSHYVRLKYTKLMVMQRLEGRWD